MTKVPPLSVCLATPQPGDFCCVPISGQVGRGIEIAQWLDGDKFQPYDHAMIYVGQADVASPNGYTVSAYPGGRGRRALACPPQQLIGSLWSSGIITLTDAERSAIVGWAMEHRNVSYSALDYVALAAHGLHIPVPHLRAYIESSKRMICSQLVDAAYDAAGVHLFSDGRWPGFVKPGDLSGMLQELMAQAA